MQRNFLAAHHARHSGSDRTQPNTIDSEGHGEYCRAHVKRADRNQFQSRICPSGREQPAVSQPVSDSPPTGDQPAEPSTPAERDDPAERLEQFVTSHFGGGDPPESLPENATAGADNAHSDDDDKDNNDRNNNNDASPDEAPRQGTTRTEL